MRETTPRLIGIAGPLKAHIRLLADPEVPAGRDPSNGLVIDDKSVSRRHCVFRMEGDGFRVVDLDSHNGTFVNDVPVNDKLLEDGDKIKIGTSLFLFMLREPEAGAAPNGVELADGNPVTNAATTLRLEDALSLMARDLGTLLKISQTVSSTRDVETLQRRLLESILDAMPAERGAIMLVEGELDAPESVFAIDRASGPGRPVRVSRTVARQVLGEGVSVLLDDVVGHEAYASAESLITVPVRSLLCVPLKFERVLGLIYLDTTDPGVRFDKDHLQLLTAVSGIASVAIVNARQFQRLEGEYKKLLADERSIVGESPAIRSVCEVIARAARSDSPVLVLGESGTGKELAAHAIHHASPRASGPFVAVNCASVTETLAESELFGHEKGAFTGAVAQKKGKFEAASGGTLFLDEVGELSLGLQSKLLRVLENYEFERVGGTRTIKGDFRLVAATNRDLKQACNEGLFRRDLFYRLNVVTLTMPALRERREDIPLLTNHFVAKYIQKCKRYVAGVSPETRACLKGYGWPGNVRELANAIERAIVLGTTDLILPEDLPEAVLESAAPDASQPSKYIEAVREMKRQFLLDAIRQAGGSYSEAAKTLGILPNNLHRLAKNLGLKSDSDN
jgi:transcriptional regulator with GAF, ATPase, and Fis domain